MRRGTHSETRKPLEAPLKHPTVSVRCEAVQGEGQSVEEPFVSRRLYGLFDFTWVSDGRRIK